VKIVDIFKLTKILGVSWVILLTLAWMVDAGIIAL